MEPLDYADIIKKMGPERDVSRLTEEELDVYNSVKAIKHQSSIEEKGRIKMAIQNSESGLKTYPLSNLNSGGFKTMNLFSKTWVRIAAGLIILIVAYFFLLKKSISVDHFYVQNFHQESDYLDIVKDNLSKYGMIDLNIESRDSILKGLDHYEKKEFIEAVRILEAYTMHYPEDHAARFYLALSQMHLSQFDAAKLHFVKLNEIQNLEFSDEVKWYYILCLLKSDKSPAQAKILLEQLKTGNGKYAQPAKEGIKLL
ncbi:MAG: hypothetical protein IPO78_12175 [Saprospiraceae bacterium]|nr:hypothetical protein [Saprospiraceae bacterium]